MPTQEELTYRDMTFEILESQYGIREDRRGILFDDDVPQVTPSATLLENLRRTRHAVMLNVDTRVYLIAEPARLLGVLCHVVDAALAELPELARET